MRVLHRAAALFTCCASRAPPAAVEDLLLWESVPKSAAVLGGATLLYVLLEWSGLPLLTWLSNLGLLAILATVLWAIASRFAGV